jgi:hypothetical protein
LCNQKKKPRDAVKIARYEEEKEERRQFVIMKTAHLAPTMRAKLGQSVPEDASNERLLRVAFGLYRFVEQWLSNIGKRD